MSQENIIHKSLYCDSKIEHKVFILEADDKSRGRIIKLMKRTSYGVTYEKTNDECDP